MLDLGVGAAAHAEGRSQLSEADGGGSVINC